MDPREERLREMDRLLADEEEAEDAGQRAWKEKIGSVEFAPRWRHLDELMEEYGWKGGEY